MRADKGAGCYDGGHRREKPGGLGETCLLFPIDYMGKGDRSPICPNDTVKSCRLLGIRSGHSSGQVTVEDSDLSQINIFIILLLLFALLHAIVTFIVSKLCNTYSLYYPVAAVPVKHIDSVLCLS